MKYEIKWDKRINNYFIHGSKLTFFKEDDEVHFENPYISPGSVIVQWGSDPNYQDARTGIQLPLLRRGKVYQLIPDLLVYPENSVAVKFCEFDRTGGQISTQAFSLQGGEFVFSETAYSYTIELISTGAEALCFKKIDLIQKQEGD